MKKISIGQAISILANVGVIAGIGLLALELRQNNELLRAQARTERVDIRKEYSDSFLENPALAGTLLRHQRGEPLTAEEGFLMERFIARTLANIQYIYGENQRGLIEDVDMPVEYWKRMFHEIFPGLPGYWEANKGVYRPDFVEFYEENVVNR